jgi:hypothetical protein
MTEDRNGNANVKEEASVFTRRKMLGRLGLVAGALYAAPTLSNLGEARASGRRGRSDDRRRRRRRGRHSRRRRFGSAS